ncbi:MAG: phosphatase PAP2 family protein [Alphaproteobacteria bacterium]|nr:phosphatase PAP2 family protein [Alphaproteobacteria bacterium]
MRGFWQQIKTACFDHRWLALVGSLYALLVIAQCLIVGVPLYEYHNLLKMVWAHIKWTTTFTAVLMLLFFFYFYAGAAWETSWRGKKLRAGFLAVAKLFDKKCEHYFDSRLFADGLIGLLTLQVLDLIGAQKSLIPYLNPFKWDPVFSEWDRVLHFNHYPFQFVAPFVENIGAWAPDGLAVFYVAWFFAMGATCFYCLFIDSSFYRHMRFIWTYLVSWAVLGSLGAVLFSSVGPIFFRDFYPHPPDLYRQVADHLEHSTSFIKIVFETKQWLLDVAHNDLILDLNAISAMPSLHVGIAWLLVLYWGTVNRWMMILAFIFFLMIFLGSIYFGFHYAIDSYFSIIGISLIWWGSGKLVHRLHPHHVRDLMR